MNKTVSFLGLVALFILPSVSFGWNLEYDLESIRVQCEKNSQFYSHLNPISLRRIHLVGETEKFYREFAHGSLSQVSEHVI